jgi:hypothetical protein
MVGAKQPKLEGGMYKPEELIAASHLVAALVDPENPIVSVATAKDPLKAVECASAIAQAREQAEARRK